MWIGPRAAHGHAAAQEEEQAHGTRALGDDDERDDDERDDDERDDDERDDDERDDDDDGAAADDDGASRRWHGPCFVASAGGVSAGGRTLRMKEQIVGTLLGRTALAVRDLLALLPRASQREQLGTVANDQLALQLVTALCRPGHVFVDVGAHIGSVVARVLDHDDGLDVVAIEAVPEKAAQLRRRFPGVTVHACAVGEAHGQASFFVHRRLSAYSSLRRPLGLADDVDEIAVPLRRLDELVVPDRVDVVKIDVEGAELAVLRGAAGLLGRARPTVLFESGAPDPGSGGFAQQALFALLSAAGYVVVVPNRLAHDDDGLSATGFAESHVYPRRTTNYFAVAAERRQELRDRARRVLGIEPGGAASHDPARR